MNHRWRRHPEDRNVVIRIVLRVDLSDRGSREEVILLIRVAEFTQDILLEFQFLVPGKDRGKVVDTANCTELSLDAGAERGGREERAGRCGTGAAADLQTTTKCPILPQLSQLRPFAGHWPDECQSKPQSTQHLVDGMRIVGA